MVGKNTALASHYEFIINIPMPQTDNEPRALKVYFGSEDFTELLEYSVPSDSCPPTHGTARNRLLFLDTLLKRKEHLSCVLFNTEGLG